MKRVKEYTNKRGYRFREELNEMEEPDGVCSVWFPNGLLRFEATYKDGELDGTCREWDEDGHLVFEAHYDMGLEILTA